MRDPGQSKAGEGARGARWSGAAVVAALLGAAAPAAAQDIVIESYGGARPGQAAELLGPLRAELSSRGYLVGGELAERIEARVSRSGAGLAAAQASDARKFVDSGYRQYVDGRYELAIAETMRGLELLRSRPAHLARHQDLRDVMFNGLVHVASSHQRTGNLREATAAMAELLRTFPDREISRARYAPDVNELYRNVKQDLETQGTGRLRLEVDDSRTVVFVNERYAGVGKTTVSDLYAGRYRVYVQQGERPGRLHEVEVEAGSEAVLSVSWELDAALATDAGYAGLEYADEAARQREEARHAVRLARAVKAGGVTVIGIQEVDGKRSIVGTVLSLDTGRSIRSGALAIEPVEPSAEKLRALARYLAGEDDADGMFALAVTGDGGGGATGPEDRGGARPVRVWKWVALVGGVGGIAGGATLIAIHAPEAEGERDEVVRDTMVPGIITLSAGVALTGVGIYLFLRDRRDAREPRLTVTPTTGGATVTLTGRF
jgi:hypothetical protein